MKKQALFILLLFSFLALSIVGGAVDVLNCSKCHQHRNLKVMTREGVVRDFHVNPDVFNSSAHKKLTCQTCHSYIKKTPHDPKNYRRVDCSVECHLEDDSIDKGYSHQRENNEYVWSAHGEANEDSIGCVACHIEHSERRSAEFSPREINLTCVGCHTDTELMAKHKVSTTVIDSYDDSYHGKAVNFNIRNSATCVSCHTTHNIRRYDDILSTRSKSKKNKTCKTEGCHPDAIARFGRGVNHQLYKGGLAFFIHELGRFSAIFVFIGVGILLFHYSFTFIRKLTQENWKYIAVFVYIFVLTLAAPYILRMMMQLKTKEVPFDLQALTPEYKSFCRICHGVLPHQKNLVLRTFMNRHSRKLACETCHIKRETGDRIDYLWYNGQVEYLSDYRGMDYDNGSKIMPYKVVGGKKIVLGMKDDGVIPLGYRTDKKGLECVRCHVEEEKSVMDFSALSYSRKEIKNFRNLEEFGMLTKDKEWVVPTLF